jgi:molybdopterin converting factor small subunit
MKVRVRLFHTLRQAVGAETLEVEVPDAGATLGDVKRAAIAAAPALAIHAGAIGLAQDMEHADPLDPVRPGAEIAFLPPVSGG